MTGDRRLLFLLQRATRAAISRANATTIDAVGTSVAQLGTLSYLAHNPGCTMTEIADLFGLNKSAVSGMITRLERAKLVRRAPNPLDGRGALLYLTEKGKRIRGQARPAFRRVSAEMTEGFSDAELAAVFRFLNELIDRFGSESQPGAT